MDYQSRELLRMLTCQVCWETLTRPIFRCKFEHLLCEGCFRNVTKCPSCREPLRDNLRSLCMEQLADIVRAPCKYCDDGCPELLSLKSKRHHEQTCAFRPDAGAAQCPLLYSCSWEGSRAAVERHVRQGHGDQLIAAPDGAFIVAESSTIVLEFDSTLFAVRAESVPMADFTSHYVHVGHVAQGLRAAETCYRFKVRVDADGTLYKGHVTDYRQSLGELAAAGDCLFFVRQADDPYEVLYSGAIKK